MAVLLGALSVWLWIIGTSAAPRLRRRDRLPPGKLALLPRPGRHVQWHWGQSSGASRGLFLQLVPALIGAFVGAPVLARELETGTFRFAWTQGFGRWRWALAKLVAARGRAGRRDRRVRRPGVLVLPAVLRPGQPGPGPLRDTPRSLPLFSLRGVAFPAWTLAAFAIGALAGMLIRRVVPAIVATLAVYAGLAVVTVAPARALPDPAAHPQPKRARHRVDHQPVVDQGRQVRLRRNPPGGLLNRCCRPPSGTGGRPSPSGTFAQCLAQHGYTHWTSYQPASRFWPFQWIEGGWLLALSVLLIAATIWLVRRVPPDASRQPRGPAQPRAPPCRLTPSSASRGDGVRRCGWRSRRGRRAGR